MGKIDNLKESEFKTQVESYLKKDLTYGATKQHYNSIKFIKRIEDVAHCEERNVDSVKVVVATKKHLCDYPEKHTVELIWDRQVGFFTEYYEL